jgi:hypothetical protein
MKLLSCYRAFLPLPGPVSACGRGVRRTYADSSGSGSRSAGGVPPATSGECPLSPQHWPAAAPLTRRRKRSLHLYGDGIWLRQAACSAFIVGPSNTPVTGSCCCSWNVRIAPCVAGPMIPSCTTQDPRTCARQDWAHATCGPPPGNPKPQSLLPHGRPNQRKRSRFQFHRPRANGRRSCTWKSNPGRANAALADTGRSITGRSIIGRSIIGRSITDRATPACPTDLTWSACMSGSARTSPSRSWSHQ